MTRRAETQAFDEIEDQFGRAGELKAAVARAEFQLGRTLLEHRLGKASSKDVERCRGEYETAQRALHDLQCMRAAIPKLRAFVAEQRQQALEKERITARAKCMADFESELEKFKDFIKKLKLPSETAKLNQAARALWQAASNAGCVYRLRKFFEKFEDKPGLEHLASW